MNASRRRRDQRQRQRHRASEAARRHAIVKAVVERLPAELHAEIHRRLDFLRRLAFASICGASSGHMLRQEAPCLILPAETKEKATTATGETKTTAGEEKATTATGETKTTAGEEKATVLSMAESESSALVRTSHLALTRRVVIGSSGGWLVTADDRAALRMANPATGAQADLPAITTIPFLKAQGSGCRWFCLHVEPFVQIRFGGTPPPPENKDWGPHPPRTSTLTAAQMRQSFYRKVVLSALPTPGSYAAMLITDRHIGAPAFATSEDPSWRMAPSRDGVEDAIHHDGRFYSITYSGVVEAWRRDTDTGEFTSRVAAPRLEYSDNHLRSKYLAAAPDGRLMAVLKHAHVVETGQGYRRTKATRVFFRVRMLDQEQRRWEAAEDIGDAALFVGVNASVCVSAAEHRGIKPGCVYFTDDEVGEACLHHEMGKARESSLSSIEADDAELRETGVYNLKTGSVVRIAAHGKQRRWPPVAWFTPSFL